MDRAITDVFLAIATPDLNRLTQFYILLLQQTPSVVLPNRYAEFRLATLRLGLFCPQAQHQAEFGSPQGAALSLCLEVENLEAAIAQVSTAYISLQSPGVEPQGPTPGPEIFITSHGREAYAYDPDGNRLILHEAVSRHPPQPQGTASSICATIRHDNQA